MTRWTRVTAIAAAVLWVGAAACTDDNKREGSTERARSGEDRSASTAPGSSSDQAAAGRTADSTTSQAPGETRGTAGTGASASAGAANDDEKTVTGTVVRANEDELVVKQAGDDKELKLEVDASTPVMMGGVASSVSALKEGTQIRASYDDSQKATRIEADDSVGGSQSSKTGPPGAPGSSGTDTPTTSPSGSGTSSEGAPGTTGGSSTSDTK